MTDNVTTKNSEQPNREARLQLLQAARSSLGSDLQRFAGSPQQNEGLGAVRADPSLLDGRALRRKGRTEQLNIRITPALKASLVNKAAARGVTIADLVILALETGLGEREAAASVTLDQPPNSPPHES